MKDEWEQVEGTFSGYDRAPARLHAALPSLARGSFSVQRLRGIITVRAHQAFLAGQFQVAPLVPHKGCFAMWSKSTSVYGLKLVLRMPGEENAPDADELCVLPAVTLPRTPKTPGENHTWSQSMFAAPFWLVGKRPQKEKCNCELMEAKLDSILAVSLNSERSTAVTEWKVPILVNFKDVAVGDELLVHWVPAEKTEKVRETKQRNWQNTASNR